MNSNLRYKLKENSEKMKVLFMGMFLQTGTFNTLNPFSATALFTTAYRWNDCQRNGQSKPGYAWETNAILISHAGLERNFTKHYTSAKYCVGSHLLIYKLDE